MKYSCGDLLKHAPFSSRLKLSFHQYVTIMNLSKGVVPSSADADTVQRLVQFGFNVDPATNYIINILDYDMLVADDDLLTIHVVRSANKEPVGTLHVVFADDTFTISETRTIPTTTTELD
jgi:Protein of unknown function (DUF424)